MMKITTLLAVIVTLASCSTLENIFQKKESAKITVTLQTHQKYCGGAQPTPEMEKGTTAPIAEEVYYFKNRITQKTVKAKTDASGLANLKLEVGDYQVYMGDKIDLTFEEFYAKYKVEQEGYENDTEACFRTYYSLPAWEVSIQADTAFTLTREIDCYTNGNPCVNYTGPEVQ